MTKQSACIITSSSSHSKVRRETNETNISLSDGRKEEAKEGKMLSRGEEKMRETIEKNCQQNLMNNLNCSMKYIKKKKSDLT